MSQSLSEVNFSLILPWLLILDNTNNKKEKGLFWTIWLYTFRRKKKNRQAQITLCKPTQTSCSLLQFPCIHLVCYNQIQNRFQMRTWTGNILTATYSVSSWAFQTHPKRPLAFISSSCNGFRPTRGDGGAGPKPYQNKEQVSLVTPHIRQKQSILLFFKHQ